MADLKLRRLTEYNVRLKDDLDLPRIRVSEAAQDLIRFCSQTRDFLVSGIIYSVCVSSLIDATLMRAQVPSVWGPVDKASDPYSAQSGGGGGGGGCCTVM